MHGTSITLKIFPTDAGFVHQHDNQRDLFRQGFGMVGNCQIISRLEMGDMLRAGNVASWKQAKQVKQKRRLRVFDAGVAHNACLYIGGTLRNFRGRYKRLQGKSEADSVTTGKLGAYRRHNIGQSSASPSTFENLLHASL